MVRRPEQYKYSGHQAYLGLAPAEILDIDPVLRHFGAKKEVARAAYREFVRAGMKLGHRDEFYSANEGRFLGSAEFMEETIHRIGETKLLPRVDSQYHANANGRVDLDRLVAIVEKVSAIPRQDFYGSGKSARGVMAKEILILTGHQLGASLRLLSHATGLSSGSVSRRHDEARLKARDNHKLNKLASKIRNQYWEPPG
jgi:hypothetical protein